MSADVVIVGGGVIGSSIAYHLLAIAPGTSVCVIERDPSYRAASSALSASSIRQQFSTPVNIAMSRYGMTFLKSIGEHLAVDDTEPAIGLTERGYLYLASATTRETMLASHATQKQFGADVTLLEPPELARRFPWMTVDGIALASLGLSAEGWFDGYSLLQAFRLKARALGAEYLTAEVVRFEMQAERISSVVLADGRRVSCGNVVNAAGPHARSVAAMAGVDLPVYPDKHCIFVFDCKEPPPESPLVIDPSGLYVRPDGRRFLCGAPRQDDSRREGQTLEVETDLFDTVVWPLLAARVPAFESIRMTAAWAGFYEMNVLDENAILGKPPNRSNLYLANGFSGHGMQHSPAAGRGIAELILLGEYRTLDLRPLGYDRLLQNKPLRELIAS